VILESREAPGLDVDSVLLPVLTMLYHRASITGPEADEKQANRSISHLPVEVSADCIIDALGSSCQIWN